MKTILEQQNIMQLSKGEVLLKSEILLNMTPLT